MAKLMRWWRRVRSGVIEVAGLVAVVYGVWLLAGDAWAWIAGGAVAIVYAAALGRPARRAP